MRTSKLSRSLVAAAIVSALSLGAAHAATVRIANQGDALSMDPHSLNETTQLSVVGNVYEPLVGRDENLKLVPRLASSWKQISPNVWRFELRKGVKFHDGKPFTADDVVFTFGRMTDKNHPFNKAYPAEFPYASDTGLDGNMASIKKVDANTVVFQLQKPDADMLAKIALPFASVLSAEHAEKLQAAGTANLINQQPVGTGPFVLKSYQKDSNIRYTKNAEYWNAEFKNFRIKLWCVICINT